jgi:uncharacterized protein YndB with AHSA1/START domain
VRRDRHACRSHAITRTLEHPQAKVWAALTTLEDLTAWFGSSATEAASGQDEWRRWQQCDDGRKTPAVLAPRAGFRCSC